MQEKSKGCQDTGCTKESCSGCEKSSQHPFEPLNGSSTVKKVIGVVSGKGGVGKSFVTAMMSVLMQRKGYQVGILDADITGPSIPKMFGVTEKAMGSQHGILPQLTKRKMKLMSVNLILDKEDTPVIWRGPILASTVKQFWTDVLWGDLDYLFLDMPPGTGDVPLTVFQSLPLDGIIIVTSPQDLVSMIVKKALHMAQMMNIPVLGFVENMSYVKCPDCGKEIHIFGKSKLDEVSTATGVPILGRIPIDMNITELVNEGRFEEFVADYLCDAAKTLENIFREA
jgi:Mrp family chromosome partitioning ATPase